MLAFLTIFLLFMSFISCAKAENIKITTWNMDWLTLKKEGDLELPPDVQTRTENDFNLLHHIATKIQSDIIALQEVDGEDALQKVFDKHDYNLILTHDPIVQNLALAIKKRFHFKINPELTDLNLQTSHTHHPLRSGIDVTVSDGDTEFRILVVHLKTGCWARPLNERKHSCPILYQQFHILENWILARKDEHIPYIILGDFNRRLTLKDPLMISLEQADTLNLTTSGYSSPCLGGSRFIDHILLGGTAQKWFIPNSLSVMTFKNFPDTALLSDHCPVSIMLHLL